MSQDENKDASQQPSFRGNASNPGPEPYDTAGENQLFGNKGEKYLRESANIEDLPDAEEMKKAEEAEKQFHDKDASRH